MSSAKNQSDDLNEATDAELLGRFVSQQDRSALKILVEKHSRLLMSVCYQVLGNQFDAEDAFQNMVVKLVQKANQIEHPNFVSTWMYRVAQREAFNLQRKQKREAIPSPLEQLDVSDSHEAEREKLQDLVALHEELDQLPDRMRGPLVLCYLEGKSRQEAARELDVTVNSIKASLESGRKKLKKRLLQRGVAFASVLAAWQTSQATSGTVVSSTLVQSAINSSLANSTTAGTTSLTTSVASSQGALIKGTTWMAVSTGKKIMTAVVASVLLAGGGTALVITNDSKTQVPEAIPSSSKNSLEGNQSPEFMDLISKIKENEKRYQNFDIKLEAQTEYFSDLSALTDHLPVELNKPFSIAVSALPESIDSTQDTIRSLKISHRKNRGIKQNEHFRLTSEGSDLYSILNNNGDNEFIQFYEEKIIANKTTQTSTQMSPFLLSKIVEYDGYLFSDFIQGGDLAKSIIVHHSEGVDETNIKIKSELQEPQVRDNEKIEIVLLEIYVEIDGTEIMSLRQRIELAADKNYIPVKQETWLGEDFKPHMTYQVHSWAEPVEGIWYPHQFIMSLFANGKKTTEAAFTTEVVSLNPDYPDSFFKLEDPAKTDEQK